MACKHNAGMTFAEVLVVVLVIIVLVLFFLPCIFHGSGGIETARATAMKNRGRGIWVAITAANEERGEQALLWPADLIKP